MKRIGVVIANRPETAIRDLIELQDDMEIVGEALESFELLMMVKETQADAVILSAASDVPGLCSHLLGEYPSLTIVVLGAVGTSTRVEQLCPSRWDITDPSNESALAALRAAIRNPCGWIRGQERHFGLGAPTGKQ